MPAHSLVIAVTSGTETALMVFYPLPSVPLLALVVIGMPISAAMSKRPLSTSSRPPARYLSLESLPDLPPLVPTSIAGRPDLASHFSWLPTTTLFSSGCLCTSSWFPNPSFWARLGLASCFSRLPSPTLLSRLWLVSCLWAEKCYLRTFSVFCLLSPLLLHGTLRFCNSLLVWPRRGFLSAWKFFFLHDSLLPLELPS